MHTELNSRVGTTHLGTTHLGMTHLGTTHLGTTHPGTICPGTTHLGTTHPGCARDDPSADDSSGACEGRLASVYPFLLTFLSFAHLFPIYIAPLYAIYFLCNPKLEGRSVFKRDLCHTRTFPDSLRHLCLSYRILLAFLSSAHFFPLYIAPLYITYFLCSPRLERRSVLKRNLCHTRTFPDSLRHGSGTIHPGTTHPGDDPSGDGTTHPGLRGSPNESSPDESSPDESSPDGSSLVKTHRR